MAKYYVGSCSFTYKGLDGTFYPPGLKPNERITFYARHFNVVEIDSSYYALPSTRNSALFVERTPQDFIFHFKAYGLMTQHRVEVKRLGRTLSEYLPLGFDKTHLYGKDAPPEMLRLSFEMFYQALSPLKAAGKLGLILFQYPPYFTKKTENMDYILQCKEWMKDYRLAIEFRHNSWTNEREFEDTMHFLSEHGLSYTSVDEPQTEKHNTVPPIAAATSNIAYVRFHGRNLKNWFRRQGTVDERFDYLYSKEELKEWIPKIKNLAEHTDQVHVMFNNCVYTYSVQNGSEMAGMLGALEDKQPVEIVTQPKLDI